MLFMSGKPASGRRKRLPVCLLKYIRGWAVDFYSFGESLIMFHFWFRRYIMQRTVYPFA